MLDGGLPIVALSCLTGEVKGHYVWCRDQKWSITSGSVQSIRESQRLVAESAGLSSMFRGSSETKRLTEDELWGFMLRADESGWLITASSAGMSDDGEAPGLGINTSTSSTLQQSLYPRAPCN